MIIMSCLLQDNKFLAELEQQRAERSSNISNSNNNSSNNSNNSNISNNNNLSPGQTLQRASSSVTDSGFLSQSSLNGSPTARS